MNSTVRVFVNDKRMATGKPWKTSFLQVYPTKKIFTNEWEWRTSVYESILSGIRFEVKSNPVKMKAVSPPKVMNEIVRPVAKKAVLNPEDSEEEAETLDRDWICGYCRLPPGNDHRMCICRGYNYSVGAWEKGRIFKQTKKTSSNSKHEDTWVFMSQTKASLPPGTYYIGDLCYALKESLYDKVFGPQYRTGFYEVIDDPSKVFMMGDTGGDGEFKGSDGYKYPVDAGIIGIASESTLDPKKKP